MKTFFLTVTLQTFHKWVAWKFLCLQHIRQVNLSFEAFLCLCFALEKSDPALYVWIFHSKSEKSNFIFSFPWIAAFLCSPYQQSDHDIKQRQVCKWGNIFSIPLSYHHLPIPMKRTDLHNELIIVCLPLSSVYEGQINHTQARRCSNSWPVMHMYKGMTLMLFAGLDFDLLHTPLK